jgi:carbamoyl-phosphate synthase small subunit
MTETKTSPAAPTLRPGIQPPDATAVLVLDDGTVFYGKGVGATGSAVGEVCFNTAMTGYQEIMTDPSYAGQIITFTFPHIGNVGANGEDIEATTPAARGLVLQADITDPSNWRAVRDFDDWLKAWNLVGIAGVDTRALTRRIREHGAPKGVVAHDEKGRFDLAALYAQAHAWPGLEGMDLAKEVGTRQTYRWNETRWALGKGFGTLDDPRFKVVAVDFGAKRNILRSLASVGCDVTVVPPTAEADDILRHAPDGVFLSNGPGDPAATGEYALPTIKKLIDSGKPIFGICLGHQLLGIALGGRTAKMHTGHRGANHPVKDLKTGAVEITSQNHGFAVVKDSLPAGVEETHISLFDGTNQGIACTDRPIFSVQYHPEASPGPHDSHRLFKRFADMMAKTKG